MSALDVSHTTTSVGGAGFSSVVSSPGAGAFPPDDFENEPLIAVTASEYLAASVSDPSDVVCVLCLQQFLFIYLFCFCCDTAQSCMIRNQISVVGAN